MKRQILHYQSGLTGSPALYWLYCYCADQGKEILLCTDSNSRNQVSTQQPPVQTPIRTCVKKHKNHLKRLKIPFVKHVNTLGPVVHKAWPKFKQIHSLRALLRGHYFSAGSAGQTSSLTML